MGIHKTWNDTVILGANGSARLIFCSKVGRVSHINNLATLYCDGPMFDDPEISQLIAALRTTVVRYDT